MRWALPDRLDPPGPKVTLELLELLDPRDRRVFKGPLDLRAFPDRWAQSGLRGLQARRESKGLLESAAT